MSVYWFKTHNKDSQIRVLDIASGDTALIVGGSSVSEPVWIGDEELLYLQSGDNGSTTLVVRNITPGGGSVSPCPSHPYLAHANSNQRL